MSDASDEEAAVASFASDEEATVVSTGTSRKLFPVNNVRGLEEKLQEFKLTGDWIEKLDICYKDSSENELLAEKNPGAIDTKAEDDFQREMAFYYQAKDSVSKAFKRLKKLGVPIKRPDDFMAEMAKSDTHMVKVREKLLSKQMVVERTEKVRAVREQKKQGKKIQREIIQQRKQEKKKMITALKKTKKGKMGADKLLGEKKHAPNRENKGKKNREFRDSKYGYGGKKKGSKLNTAESSAFQSGGQGKGGSQNRGPKNQKGNFGKQRMKKHRRRR